MGPKLRVPNSGCLNLWLGVVFVWEHRRRIVIEAVGNLDILFRRGGHTFTRLVKSLLEQSTGLEMGLPPCGHVDDLARTGIPRSRLGTGVLYLEHAKAANFDPIPLDQAVAHGDEEAIHHFGGEILLAARALAYEECQILFCNGRQGARPPIRDVVGAVVREGQKSVISCF